VALVFGAIMATSLLRFGMLALVAMSFYLGSPGNSPPFTLPLGAWHGHATLGWLLSGYALALFGLYTATGGRPFGAGRLLED
jgi:hypothetical protein